MLSEHVHFESLLLPVGMNMYYLCAGETKCSLKLRKKKCAYISIGSNELETLVIVISAEIPHCVL